MSRTLNKVMLIGNVGKDPEIKYTPSGTPVVSFRLATTDSWKDKDGNLKEQTDWHTIVAWRGLAEVVQKIVKKGSRIYLEGKIQSRTYEDKSQNKRHVVEIVAENMLMLDGKKNYESKGDFHGDYDEYYATDAIIDDNHEEVSFGDHEIPF